MSHQEVLIIIDRSGSMHSLRESTVSNFNELLGELKESDSEVRMTLIFFNLEMTYQFKSRKVSDCAPLSSSDFEPSGTTALYDAVGEGIEHLHSKIEESKSDVSSVKAVIMTDGLENSSQRFTKQDIKKKISYVKEWYQWKFQFFGANIDEAKEAEKIGIAREESCKFDHSFEGVTESFRSMSNFIRNSDD